MAHAGEKAGFGGVRVFGAVAGAGEVTGKAFELDIDGAQLVGLSLAAGDVAQRGDDGLRTTGAIANQSERRLEPHDMAVLVDDAKGQHVGVEPAGLEALELALDGGAVVGMNGAAGTAAEQLFRLVA